jgi:hypothetical protein
MLKRACMIIEYFFLKKIKIQLYSKEIKGLIGLYPSAMLASFAIPPRKNFL